MTRLPFTNIVLLIGVLALAVIQCVFSWQFWYSSAAEGGQDTLPFAIFGVTVAIIELVMLTVATNAAVRGFPINGWFGRAVFAFICAGNYACDVAAITTFTSADASYRQSEAVRYQDAATTADELKARISDLHDRLATQGLDLPAASLRRQVEELARRVQDSSITEATRRWRQGELAKLESALIIAEEVARLEEARSAARAESIGQGAQPSPYPPYIESMMKALSWVGIITTPEDTRIGISIMLATMMRLVLGFGVWFAVGPFSRANDDGIVAPRQERGPDDFRRRAMAMWRWPKSWLAPPKPVPVAGGYHPGDKAGGQSGPAAPLQPLPPRTKRGDGEQRTQEEKTGSPPQRKPRAPKSRGNRDDDPLDDLDPVD